MVTDFKHLGFMKDFIDDNLDHKFIIDKNDPGFDSIVSFDYDFLKDGDYLSDVLVDGLIVGEVINLSRIEALSLADKEVLESFFIVDFLPTSENLAKYIYGVTSIKLDELVSGVDWQETAKSIARYRGIHK